MTDLRCHRCSLTLVWLVLGISAFFVFACTASVTRDELLRQMQEGTAPLIVDVRSQGEFNRDHVPGAVHISFYSIGSGLKEMSYPKTEPVVLYCEHGPRAGIAGISLYLSGYDNVYSLEGNMRGWRKNEFPIEIMTH